MGAQSSAAPGPIRGMLSGLIVITVVYVGLVGLVTLLGYERQFRLWILTNDWIWVPAPARAYVAETGPEGVLATALVASGNILVVTALAVLVGYLGVQSYLQNRHRTAIRHAHRFKHTPDTLGGPTPGLRFALRAQAGAKEVHILEPVDEGYIRVPRKSIKAKRQPRNAHERLQKALLEILEAHADWTVDPAGHHSDVGLAEHSRRVARKLRRALPDERLAYTVGLAHDIGKILAYEPSGQGWKHRYRHHAQLGAQIVRLLPEFQYLPEGDRRLLNLVLSYSHQGVLPKADATPRARRLMRALRTIDGLETRRDKDSAHDRAGEEQVIEALKDALPRAIQSLNINGAVNQDYEEGWTMEVLDFVAIDEAKLRRHLRGTMKPSIEMAISLGAEREHGREHPATQAIIAALEQMGWVYLEYQHQQPDNGLFWIRAGRFHFERILLIKRGALEEAMADTVSDWGDYGHPIKVSEPKPGKAANTR